MIRRRSQQKPRPGSKAALRIGARVQRRPPTPLASNQFNRYEESVSEGRAVESVITEASNKSLVTAFETRSNWAKTYSRDLRVAKVKSEGDIIQAVRYARNKGLSVRAMGSMYSWPTVAVPTNEVGNKQQPVSLDMHGYNQILRVDPKSREVEVQAGCRIKALNHELRQLGLALETLGNVDGQTISGVISTGTHGKNPALGTISSLVRSMRLVTSSGEVIKINKDDPLYNAVGVSVGMLGIISTVTLRVTAAHDMEYFIEDFGFDVGLSLLDTVIGKYEAISYIYFPTIDRFRVELGKRVEPQDAERVKYHHPPEFNKVQIFGLNLLLGALSWLVVTCGWFLSPVLKLIAYLSFTHGRPQSPYFAPSHKVVVNNSSLDIKHYEMEFAFDRADTKAVLKEIRECLKRVGSSPSDIVDVRFTSGDPFWLSPAYGRDTVWIDFIVTKQGYSRYKKLYNAVLQVAKRYNGRPHWGKVNLMGATYTSQCFPKSVEFEIVRQKMDPENAFFNTYLDKFNEATCQQQTGLLIQRRELRAKARQARREGKRGYSAVKRNGRASEVPHPSEQGSTSMVVHDGNGCSREIVVRKKSPHHHKLRPGQIVVDLSPMHPQSKVQTFVPQDKRPKWTKTSSENRVQRMSPTKVCTSPRTDYHSKQPDGVYYLGTEPQHVQARFNIEHIGVNASMDHANSYGSSFADKNLGHYELTNSDVSPMSCSTCSPRSGDSGESELALMRSIDGIDLKQCLRCDCSKSCQTLQGSQPKPIQATANHSSVTSSDGTNVRAPTQPLHQSSTVSKPAGQRHRREGISHQESHLRATNSASRSSSGERIATKDRASEVQQRINSRENGATGKLPSSDANNNRNEPGCRSSVPRKEKRVYPTIDTNLIQNSTARENMPARSPLQATVLLSKRIGGANESPISCSSCASCSTCGAEVEGVAECCNSEACSRETILNRTTPVSVSSASILQSPASHTDEEKVCPSDDEANQHSGGERRFFTLDAYENYRKKVDEKLFDEASAKIPSENVATKTVYPAVSRGKQYTKHDRCRGESEATLPVAEHA